MLFDVRQVRRWWQELGSWMVGTRLIKIFSRISAGFPVDNLD
jgi:hypothetical protein